MRPRLRRSILVVLAVLSSVAAASGGEPSWPDLSKPAPSIGGGNHDAAVIVGIENYDSVPQVFGAEANARQWYDYLTQTRGVPPENVSLLIDKDATREEILDAVKRKAREAGKIGALWFIFIGHGAPSAEQKDGLLVGVDAQQKANILEARSVRRQELLSALAASRAAAIRVVIDACFSGRGQDGSPIIPGLQPLINLPALAATDPRITLLTAAKQDEFAGPLPGADIPAFSYLVLGGLRGWAAESDGRVTAEDLRRYSSHVLEATLHGRTQTPDIIGAPDALFAVSAGEQPPNLVQLAKDSAGMGDQIVHDKHAREEHGRKLWISGGLAGMGTTFGWHGEIAVRDVIPRWSLAIDAAGPFAQTVSPAGGSLANIPILIKETYRTFYQRLKVDYLFPIVNKTPFIAIPNFWTLGGGGGVYEVNEHADHSGGGVPETTTTTNSLMILPLVDTSFIWKLGTHEELRLAGEYAVPTGPRLGLKHHIIGGLGFTADLDFRFK